MVQGVYAGGARLRAVCGPVVEEGFVFEDGRRRLFPWRGGGRGVGRGFVAGLGRQGGVLEDTDRDPEALGAHGDVLGVAGSVEAEEDDGFEGENFFVACLDCGLSGPPFFLRGKVRERLGSRLGQTGFMRTWSTPLLRAQVWAIRTAPPSAPPWRSTMSGCWALMAFSVV